MMLEKASYSTVEETGQSWWGQWYLADSQGGFLIPRYVDHFEHQLVRYENGEIDYEIDASGSGISFDQTTGRDGAVWTAYRGGDRIRVYRNGSLETEHEDEFGADVHVPNDVVIAKNPDQYYGTGTDNEILFASRDSGGIRITGVEDFRRGDSGEEEGYVKFQESFDDLTGSSIEYIQPAQGDYPTDGAWSIAAISGGSIWLITIEDSSSEVRDYDPITGIENEYTEGEIDARAVELIDIPSGIDPSGIHIEGFDTFDPEDASWDAAVTDSSTGKTFHVSPSEGWTELPFTIQDISRATTTSDGEYITAIGKERALVWDLSNDPEVVLDTTQISGVDEVTGAAFNPHTDEFVIGWSNNSIDDYRLSFFNPPHDDTFKQASGDIEDLISADCSVTGTGPFRTGDTAEITTTFTNSSATTAMVSATWEVAGMQFEETIEVSGDGDTEHVEEIVIEDVDNLGVGEHTFPVTIDWNVEERLD